jgi:hypothetical protein
VSLGVGVGRRKSVKALTICEVSVGIEAGHSSVVEVVRSTSDEPDFVVLLGSGGQRADGHCSSIRPHAELLSVMLIF